MSKKFFSIIIPITIAVVARSLLFRPKPEPSHYAIDSIVNARSSAYPHDDKVDCFLDTTIDNLKIKVQFMCGAQSLKEVDGKLDSIQSYTKSLDHGISEKLEITHRLYPLNRSPVFEIERFVNQRIVKGMGRMDSISRIQVGGIEGVRQEFESEPLIELGIKGYYRHLCYYLVYKGHIIELDYSVGGKKEAILYTGMYYPKCEQIFEDMIINTQLSVI